MITEYWCFGGRHWVSEVRTHSPVSFIPHCQKCCDEKWEQHFQMIREVPDRCDKVFYVGAGSLPCILNAGHDGKHQIEVGDE